MIKIAQKPRYSAKINVAILGDNGRHENVSFTLFFRRLTQSELEEMQSKVEKKEWTDNEVISHVVDGFGDDVKDENDQLVPFNDENLKALIDIYPVRPAVVRAYYDGLNSAKAKN